VLEEVEAVCSRAVIINRGMLVADGTPGQLAARAPSGRLDDLFRSLTNSEEAAA
jgi:ABC-2 type transport system ATP-binding protein